MKNVPRTAYGKRNMRQKLQCSRKKHTLNQGQRTSLFRKRSWQNGKVVHIRGGIKSLDLPCKEEALSAGKHPYTCDNCYLQLRELQDTLRHQKKGSLENAQNRLGLRGFNKRYAKKGEVANALEIKYQCRRAAEAKVKQLVRISLSPR